MQPTHIHPQHINNISQHHTQLHAQQQSSQSQPSSMSSSMSSVQHLQHHQLQQVGGQQQQQVGPPSRSHRMKQSLPPMHMVEAPSKVLHIRGIPPYTTENDLLLFFSSLPIGVLPSRILILPNSNQAFIQLNSVESAAALLQQQQAMGGSLLFKGSKSIILQYSNRQEIHTPPLAQHQQPPNNNGLTNGGVSGSHLTSSHPHAHSHHQQQQQQSQHQHPHPHGVMGMSSSVGGGGLPDSQQQANSILIVTVLNTRVPVTLDHIHSICKPYGDVLKIITFHKNSVFKALVQFGTVESAVNARMMLEGKDIFQGCCHLRIGFSSLPELHVKSPGNNARDFTTPTGATQTFNGGEGYGGNTNVPQHYPHQSTGLIHTNGGYSAHPQSSYAQTNDPNTTVPSSYHHHPSSHSHPSAHSTAPGHVQSTPAPQVPGCVVLVSNLPPDRITCDILFTLMGVYGDVQRVKILYQKRDTALVQYLAPQSAYLATLHLNHLTLYGKQISVTPSKHVEVSMPKTISGPNVTSSQADEAQAGLTQDYSHSPIHRFKRTSGVAGVLSSSNMSGLGIHAKSIHPPSQVLHVSSLADAVTEDEVRQLFSSLSRPPTNGNGNGTDGESSTATGAGSRTRDADEEKISQTPPIVQFFTSTPKTPMVGGVPVKPSKQAFLKFESVTAAVENLIEFHNYNLHGRYLRISFSGKDPSQVHETYMGQPIQTTTTNGHEEDATHQNQSQQQQFGDNSSQAPSSSLGSPHSMNGKSVDSTNANLNGQTNGNGNVANGTGGAEGEANQHE